jgi:uncharacterized protein
MTAKERIDDFLAQKRFAFVGVSRRPNDFSRALFREFRAKGWDPVPVHPGAQEVEGQRCYARVQDIQPPVDSALLMTSPDVASSVARDCISAGIRRVWFYRAGGRGALSGEAVEQCRSNGLSVIPGECPMMFLPEAGWIHRLHGLVRKITGTYPGQGRNSGSRADDLAAPGA